MAGLGVANISFNTLARTLLQLGTDAAMQGRVIALHSIVFLGSTPIGRPITGWICEQWGARAGLLVAAKAVPGAAVAVPPSLRRARPPTIAAAWGSPPAP